MTTLVAEAVIKAVDRFSGPMNKMAMSASRAAGTMETKMASASRRMRGVSTGMTGIAAAIASTKMITGMVKWDEAARKAQATALVWSDADFAPVRGEMERLALKYPAMIGEVAKGTNELFMAGMGMDDVLAKNARGFSVLEMMIQGAMASGESFKTVGAGVTDVIMAMGLPWATAEQKVSSFKRVNDLLAMGASAANQDYQEYLTTLSYTSPVAKAVGMDLTTLIALSGALANAGIKGSKAGTGLRALMIKPLGLSGKKVAMLKDEWHVDLQKYVTQNRRHRSGGDLVNFIRSSTGIDAKGLGMAFDKVMKDPAVARNAGLMGDRLMGIIGKNFNMTGDNALLKPVFNDVIRDFVTSGFGQLRLIPLLKEMGSKGMTPGDIADVFGLRHVPKALALIDQLMTGKFRKLHDRIINESTDAAAKKAAIQMRGTLGEYRTMLSAFDVSPKIAMARSGVWKELGTAFHYITESLKGVRTASPTLLKLGIYSTMALGAMVPLGYAMFGLTSALGGFSVVAKVGFGLLAKISAGAIVAYAATDLLARGFTGLFNHLANAPKNSISGKIWEGMALGVQKVRDAYKWASDAVGEFWSLYNLKQAGAVGGGGAMALAGNFDTSKISMWDWFLDKGRAAASGIKTAFADLWGWIAAKFKGTALASGLGWIGDKVSQLKGWLVGQWDGSWLQKMLTQMGSNRYVNSPIKSLLVDLSAFGSWIDTKTGKMADFWQGLFGGLEKNWKGSQLERTFTFIKDSITGMFDPAAGQNAKALGDKISSYLLNPLTALKDLMSGGLGAGGVLAGLFVMRPLIGPMLHMGASVAIMGKGLFELGVGIFKVGAGAGRLLMAATGLTAVALSPWLVAGAAAATALYVAWEPLTKTASGFSKGFMKNYEGSSLEKLLGRLSEKIQSLTSRLAPLTAKFEKLTGFKFDWGNMGEGFGEGAFELVNGFVDAVGRLKDYLSQLHWPEPPEWMSTLADKFKSFFVGTGRQVGTGKQDGGILGGALQFMYGKDGLLGPKTMNQMPDYRKYTGMRKQADGSWAHFSEQRVQRGENGIYDLSPRLGQRPKEIKPLGVGAFSKGALDITGKVDAELKGKGHVQVTIVSKPSPMLMSEIKGMMVQDEGHLQVNAGVSNADVQSGN